MQNLSYLFAAYTIVWGLVFLYIHSIARRQRALQKEIAALKASRREPADN